MRTNIKIDDDLMNEALKWSELKSKKEVVNEAIKEYINQLKRQKIKSLRGKVEWIGDLDKKGTYDKWEDRGHKHLDSAREKVMTKTFDNIAKYTSLKIYKNKE